MMNRRQTAAASPERLSEKVTLRLDAATLVQLRQIARQKGIGPTTLIRMWILERLGG